MATRRTINDGSVRWLARHRGPDGRERTKTYIRAEDARRWEREQRHAVDTARWVDPRRSKVAFRDVAEEWEGAQRHWSPNTARVMASALKVINTSMGDRKLGEITRAEVDSMIDSWDVAPATVRARMSVVKMIFNDAVTRGDLGRSPVTGIRLARSLHVPVRPLSIDQVQMILSNIEPTYAPLVSLGALAGLRISEALALRVADVLPQRAEIIVTGQLDRAGTIVGVKSAKGVRSVPLSAPLRGALEGVSPGAGGRFFAVSANEAGRAFRAACEAVGLSRSVTFHDLRHHFASLLIEGGASVVRVSAILGHASPVITLTTYAHLFASQDHEARRIIEDAWRQDSSPDSITK